MAANSRINGSLLDWKALLALPDGERRGQAAGIASLRG